MRIQGGQMKGRIVAGLTAVSFVAVMAWLVLAEEPAAKQTTTATAGLPVSVLEVHPGDATITYKTTGITRPRWPTEVVAAVDGRVDELDETLEPGSLLAKGATLVRLLDTAYRSEFETAQARVATAELALARLRREQTVLKKDALTAFGRREPHIKAAEAELDAATAVRESARQRLNDTHVTAPFPAIIVERLVSPGQWVASGDVLYRLAASDSVDVEVELSAPTWQQLGDIANGIDATVTAPSGRQWAASLRYLNPTMNPTTRQRSLVLKVTEPYRAKPPLLPDQQVEIGFRRPPMAQVVSAPASVLTEDGKVWTVTDDKLALEDVSLLSERHDRVLLRFAERPKHDRLLVRYPLSIMLEGQRVSPKLVDDQHEGAEG